jgi:hypothetical protein
MKYPVFAIIEQKRVCRTHDVTTFSECEEMNPDLSVESRGKQGRIGFYAHFRGWR